MDFDDDKYNLWFIYNGITSVKRRGEEEARIVRFDSMYFNEDNNGELGDIHTKHVSHGREVVWQRFQFQWKNKWIYLKSVYDGGQTTIVVEITQRQLNWIKVNFVEENCKNLYVYARVNKLR